MDLRESRASNEATRHPWETARANFVTQVLGSLLPHAGESLRILDCGSGDCFVASRIADHIPQASIDCFDPEYSADEIQRYNALRPGRVRASSQRAEGRYDVVLFLDVLEHVEQDVALLRETVATSLRPGGQVLITVPAIQALFSDHDRVLGHFRRYSSRTLEKLASDAGLRVARSGGLFSLLLAPRALGVAREVAQKKLRDAFSGKRDTQRKLGLGHWRGSPSLTRTLDWVLTRELFVETSLASLGVPVPGLSRWLLGQKPQ